MTSSVNQSPTLQNNLKTLNIESFFNLKVYLDLKGLVLKYRHVIELFRTT